MVLLEKKGDDEEVEAKVHLEQTTQEQELWQSVATHVLALRRLDS